MKTSSTIGNEHFKIWLKRLDPVSRVQKMSDIAKTQYSAGVKGSLIKASLAQLSQRCHVMLMKLTDSDIKHYTRRKPVKRLHAYCGQDKDSFSSEIKTLNLSKKTIVCSSKKVKSKSRSTCVNPIKVNTIQSRSPTNEILAGGESTISKLSSSNSRDSSNTNASDSINSRLTIIKDSSANKRLKKKYQELFGDDLDDVPMKKYGCDDLTGANSNDGEKRIKNYFNTVNVNIYNTSTDISNDKYNIVEKTTESRTSVFYDKKSSNKKRRVDVSRDKDNIVEKKAESKKGVLYVKKSSNKKLRVDVSISGDKSGVDIDLLNDKKDKSENDTYSKIKTKSSARNSDSYKHKIKPSKPKHKSALNINTGNTEEDPSNKKLWSILGMESPTDRSESIIKSYPLHCANKEKLPEAVGDKRCKTKDNPSTSFLTETFKESRESSQMSVTSENEKVQAVLPVEPKDCSQSLPDNTDLPKELAPFKESRESFQMSVTSENEKVQACPPVEPKDCTESLPDQTDFPEECAPVCKIAETFSLANLLTVADSGIMTFIPKTVDGNNTNSQSGECKNSDKEKHKDLENSCIIETILILDDDDEPVDNPVLQPNTSDMSGSKDNLNNKEHSKVGTIRVKSLGLLMNPELPSHLNSAENGCTTASSSENIEINVTNAHESFQCIQLNNDEQKDLEQRFSATYNLNFDKFVELRIPKLGELLHLAIADLIRKEERIKRAEQLSSDDLINDEKQRAEKDFNDMMKTRGNEFSPLFEAILEKFEEHSKASLFVSLFCRLLKHAQQIDPTNKDHTIKARDVIRVMLSKRQFKEILILDLLTSDAKVFQGRVDIINSLVTKCTNTHKITNNIGSQSLNQSSVGNNVPIRHISRPPVLDSNYSSIRSNNDSAVNSMINAMIAHTTTNTSTPTKTFTVIGTKIPARKSTMSVRNMDLQTNTQGNNTFIQLGHIPQTSSRQILNTNHASLPRVNLPNTPITANGSTNYPRQDQVTSQCAPHSYVQTTSSFSTNMLPSTVASSSSAILQESLSSTSTHLQTTVNSTFSQEYVVTKDTLSKPNPYYYRSYRIRQTETSIDQSHAAANERGAELNRMDMSRQRHNVIVCEINKSAPAIFGLDPKPLNCTMKNGEDSVQGRVTAANSSSSNLNYTSANTTTEVNKSGVTSNPGQEDGVTVNVLLDSSQVPLPSSSHCHPFGRRMPIGGKMRMLFGNSNSSN